MKKHLVSMYVLSCPRHSQCSLTAFQGAQQLGKYMEENFGEDAFVFLIDEGGSFKFPSVHACRV